MFKAFFQLNRELLKNRKIILSMGKADFKNEYAGSALGIIWGVIKPFILIAVYSFVFGAVKNNGIPFYIWVIPGLFLWTFLSDSLTGGTSAIRSNSHLVKKVVFPVSILPSTKIMTALLNHILFMCIALIIIVLSGQTLPPSIIQVVYYLFSSIIFTVFLTRLLSAMAVMSVDIVHFISTIMQILFWASPVLWSPEMGARFSAKIVFFLQFNPYFYLVEGYRDSFFSGKWFWEKPELTIYFWSVTLCIGLIGSLYYKRARSEFADVL